MNNAAMAKSAPRTGFTNAEIFTLCDPVTLRLPRVLCHPIAAFSG